MAKRTFRVERSRSPLIATTLVLVSGIATCLMISVPFADDLTGPLLVIAGLMLFLCFILGLMRTQTESKLVDLYTLVMTKPKKKVQLKLKRKETTQQTAPRKPPTAEEIRELKGW